jgi:pimeloyl-ACP methyl ester carboxylesterase
MTDTANGTRTGRTIDVNGATLYYEEEGRGLPLVLVHGGLFSLAMYAALWPHLTDAFRVIALDSRGHGRSTNPGGALSYRLIADDVAALIGALGLARPLVGGWSDGGHVALEFGVRHPGVAGGLLVGAAAPDFANADRDAINREILGVDAAGRPSIAHVERQLGALAAVVKSWHPGGESQWHAIVHQTARMWLAGSSLTPEQVGRMATPALVLTGDRDTLAPLDPVIALYRMLPNAELAVCPLADHGGPMTPARAPLFAAMIRDFGARHASS